MTAIYASTALTCIFLLNILACLLIKLLVQHQKIYIELNTGTTEALQGRVNTEEEEERASKLDK